MAVFQSESIEEFTELLASKEPVPGGGGGSALAGALGISLGHMVGALTVGKKKYKEVETEIESLMTEAEFLRKKLLQLIDRDGECFLPLSKAYAVPKEAPERAELLENALQTACTAPVEIMRTICRALELLDQFEKKGALIAVSDAGGGALFCKAALQGASLNVFVNTRLMKNPETAAALEKEVEDMLSEYCPLADKIHERVMEKMRQTPSS